MKETTINEYDHVDVNDTNIQKCIQISIHYSNLCMTIYCKIYCIKNIIKSIYLWRQEHDWL